MSKKTRYFIETLGEGKVNFYTIKYNKNKPFLKTHPLAEEVSQQQYNNTQKAIIKIKKELTNANQTDTI